MLVRTLRALKRQFRRLRRPETEPEAVRRVLEDLDVGPGSTVLVHSSLRSLGNFPGGADGFLDFLIDHIGPQGTLLMPSFPTTGAMEDFVRDNPEVDLRTIPSQSGYLTESFRKRPGVRRSFHPTHPVCALGKRANEILGEHESAKGPNGVGSPFDHLFQADGMILRIGTDANTPCHYVQELIDYPNQFLEGRTPVVCHGMEGGRMEFELRVYRKMIPNLTWVSADSGEVCGVHPVNFLLLQPGRAQAAMEGDPAQSPVVPRLLRQRTKFLDKGWLRASTLHGAIWESYRMKPLLSEMTEVFAAEIAKHRDRYELGYLQKLLAEGKYPVRRTPKE
jgi:aminoglycoside N3'-acetyltransferase